MSGSSMRGTNVSINIESVVQLIKDGKLIAPPVTKLVWPEKQITATLARWGKEGCQPDFGGWVAVKIDGEYVYTHVPELLKAALIGIHCVLASYRAPGSIIAIVRMPWVTSQVALDELAKKLRFYICDSLGGEIEWCDIEIQKTISVWHDSKLRTRSLSEVSEFNPEEHPICVR